MDCHVHPGTAAVSQCRSCRRGICPDCAEPKRAPDMGWVVNGLRRALVGSERAVWAEGSPTVLYCKPDCDAFLSGRRAQSLFGRVWSGLLAVQLAVAGCVFLFAGVGLVVFVVLAIAR